MSRNHILTFHLDKEEQDTVKKLKIILKNNGDIPLTTFLRPSLIKLIKTKISDFKFDETIDKII